MKLLIDIGNTLSKFAYDTSLKEEDILSVNTSDIKRDDFVFPSFKDVDSVYISSVVPLVSDKVTKYFSSLNKKVFLIKPKDNKLVKLDIDNVNELGSDLFCDLVSASKKYQGHLLIVDLGTASKILYLNKDKVFVSCAIVPGLDIVIKSLGQNTALIDTYEFEEPKELLKCKNTKDVVISSAIYSHIDVINGFVNRFKKEINEPVKIILTGGHASKIRNDLNFSYSYEPLLTLLGIKELSLMEEYK